MKFYNYFSDSVELKKYLEGVFSGKGIYFDPDEFQKKETLRSKLKLSCKHGNLKFQLKRKNKLPMRFQVDTSEIFDLKEDICKIKLSNMEIQIQAMTKNKLHIHISGSENKANLLYMSGIINRKRLAGFLKEVFLKRKKFF